MPDRYEENTRNRRSRLANHIGEQLGELLDTEKSAGRPVKLVRMKVAAMAARLLFRELASGK